MTGAPPPIFELIERGDLAALAAALADAPHAGSAEDAAGASLLHAAARAGRADVVELLLRAGAPIEARDRLHDSTALAWAAYHGNVRAVEVLVRAGADTSIRNRYQLTPLEIAAGGARGEHAQDCPGRTAADFDAIVALLGGPLRS